MSSIQNVELKAEKESTARTATLGKSLLEFMVRSLDCNALVFSAPFSGKDNSTAARSILKLRQPLIFIYREKVLKVG